MNRKNAKILIVDDNKDILKALKYLLEDYFTTIETTNNPELLPSKIAEGWDVVILDMNFKAGYHSGNEGLFWMGKIFECDPDISVVFITAYAGISLAVEAVKRGADDFIEKPWDDERMVATILKVYRSRRNRIEIKTLKEKNKNLINSNLSNDFVKGKSASMIQLNTMIQKIAPTDANVLIIGENGTGKEIVAQELHRLSNRKDEAFITADLQSISESLFESELFGHTKGAFTDAKVDRTGRFEMASGGTLFLDEIGNISLNLQSKILSTLNNRTIQKVGSSESLPIDIRLISATNRNLTKMVADGTFREDLLYRINTIFIELPPLRDRVEDIPDLSYFFLARFAGRYNKPIKEFSFETIMKLCNYSWPGNIRELKHAIEKAVILTENSILTVTDFSFQQTNSQIEASITNLNLEENEKLIIQLALKKHHGKINETVKELGVSRKTLYNKMKLYGL